MWSDPCLRSQAPLLDVLILASCPSTQAVARPPDWLDAANRRFGGGTGPSLRWRCYGGLDRLGQSLWRKTAALLQVIAVEFPKKEFYLKMDSDAMVRAHPHTSCQRGGRHAEEC